ncbi:MAG: glycosyltransferase family 4 protein [Paludibacter sp.]
MNILFLTISRIDDILERGIYTDLVRKFRDEGHSVFIATPTERRYKQQTELFEQDNIRLLKIKTLNFQKTNIIEKGIGTLLIEYQFLIAVKKYFAEIKFDLVLYSTPPITFTKVVRYIKQNHLAKSYLLLKDIFPQNAVDLMMMKKNGFIHRFFETKEKEMYAISDSIGCMSMANVEYIHRNNPSLKPEIVHINPNSIEPENVLLTKLEKNEIRKQFGIPNNKTIFVYGGNLGKPQGVDFLIEVIAANVATKNIFFVIVGSGTEFDKMDKWFKLNQPSHAILLTSLPKKEYDKLVQACDVGLIFLDKRFTIPNYPSRLLSYLEYKMPIITATDSITDIGTEAELNGYGFYCENGNLELINTHIKLLTENQKLVQTMGEKGHQYLLENFTVEKSYSIIMNQLN